MAQTNPLPYQDVYQVALIEEIIPEGWVVVLDAHSMHTLAFTPLKSQILRKVTMISLYHGPLMSCCWEQWGNSTASPQEKQDGPEDFAAKMQAALSPEKVCKPLQSTSVRLSVDV